MAAALLVAFAPGSVARPPTPGRPNVVVIFADDMGYGDLGCFGATGWATPNLDRMAKEGVRFTDFHAAEPVCSASRSALMTGCYPTRIGIHGALGPQARVGLSDGETTLAELCKQKGYATGMVGKWHLGHHRRFLPTHHGFDSYLGLPYSNDMWPHHPERPKGYPNLPLIDGDRIIDPDVTAEDQATLTRRYTERAVKFIGENKDRPFFLYFAHSFPHVPLFASEKFRGSSKQGLYGDVIQEIDWSVGRVLAALKDHGLERDTLVMFTSDNGPWLSYGNQGGTAGPLREGKGTVWEGGVREPFVARWPGVIPAGSVQTEPAMTIDVLPTVAKLIGAELPKHKIDGNDIGPLLRCEPGAKCPHEAFYFYYKQGELEAIRSGKWKLMLPHTYRTMQGQPPGKDGQPGKYRQAKVERPELYNLSADIGESKDVAAEHPDAVKKLLGYAEEARKDLGDTLTKRKGTGVREPGRLPKGKQPFPPAPSPKRGGGAASSSPPRFGEGPGEGLTSELVFPLHPKHNHAPGIAECPNGDLLVSWYRGSGERSADDVAVYGARLRKGAKQWSEAFLLADTPGFPDCNTALFVGPKGRLWLFWPVILANSWESCLTHYRVASDYQSDGPPKWDWQDTLALKPVDFEPVMLREFENWKKLIAGRTLSRPLREDVVKERIANKLLSRLGWQPRCKPTVLASGRWLLPLYSDTYSAGLMAISDDQGKTWTASKPLAAFGGIQPAVLQRADGSLVAYMRENGPLDKVRVSESRDDGLTWGTVGVTELPNPGSGLDAVRLANGHWLLVYNDTTRGRNSLAVSVSDDEGKTWKWTRHLERHDTGSYHYPAVIQAKDGSIHAVYSYFVAGGKSMKHARLTEDWVKEGDK
ncbi:MAG TPA: sulfatase-like hydrolase/transferase [Fimbriiglobus sp.]|nr:sulfatase-like hydrolase/transferase [Fimbriiglobus sp.]